MTAPEPDNEPDSAIIERLYDVIKGRRDGDPETSYTARLHEGGAPLIAQKLGAEAVEAVIATVQGEGAALVAESADLLYHLLVAWAHCGVAPAQVWAELARREGISGLEEKRARSR